MPNIEEHLQDDIITFIQGDLRKLDSTFSIYKNQASILRNKIIQNMFQLKIYNEDEGMYENIPECLEFIERNKHRNPKIKSINYNEDIDNVRNIRSIGISTFTGDVTIKGDKTDIQSYNLTTKSNDIVLGFTTTGTFTGSINAGSNVVSNVLPTDNIVPNIGVTLTSASGNLDLGSGVTVVSIASSSLVLSSTISGNGSDSNAVFTVGSSNDNIANDGGIVIKGTTDKSMLWQQSTNRFNFSHGITLNTGVFQILDGTSKISIGVTDVLTSDKIFGRLLTDEIVVSNDNTNYIPTAIAVTKRTRKVSAEGYFASNSL